MITANDVLEVLATVGLERIPVEIIQSWTDYDREMVYNWAANQAAHTHSNPQPDLVRRMQNEVVRFIQRDLEYLEGVCDAVRNDRGVARINSIRNNLKRMRRV